MARYIGAVCKLCRREGGKLYLKGERCYSEKCAVSRRPYPPGQHGQARIKLSEYGLRLREKQKMRRIYGLLEMQFAGYYVQATHLKGRTGRDARLDRASLGQRGCPHRVRLEPCPGPSARSPQSR